MATDVIQQILQATEEPWIERLRRNHRIWLVKQEQVAIVAFAWDPPEPGVVTGTGRLALQPLVDNHVQPVQVWFVDLHGRGIDRRQIILPIDGNLPEAPTPIAEPVIRQLRRANAQLVRRVESVEKIVSGLMVAVELLTNTIEQLRAYD